MPTSVAKLLGLLSRLNQFPQRVALFPLFEEVGEALLSEELTLDAFAAGKVSVPRVKIIADGSIQGYTGYLSEPYYAPFKGDPFVPRLPLSAARGIAPTGFRPLREAHSGGHTLQRRCID
jgi:hypothetical protein